MMQQEIPQSVQPPTPSTSHQSGTGVNERQVPLAYGSSAKAEMSLPPTYQEALSVIKTLLPELNASLLAISATFDEEGPDDLQAFAIVCHQFWPAVVGRISALRVDVLPVLPAVPTLPSLNAAGFLPRPPPVRPLGTLFQPRPSPALSQAVPLPPTILPSPTQVLIKVRYLELAKLCILPIDPADPFNTLYNRVQMATSVDPIRAKLNLNGLVLPPYDITKPDLTVSSQVPTLKNMDVVDLIAEKVRKPVVYLYPPTPTKATVKVSLSPEWQFDTIYPPAEAKWSEEGLQTIEWKVDAQPNGDLADEETGIQVSYLFWEAGPVPTRGVPRTADNNGFSPTSTRCTPSESVLVASESLPKYLDSALKTLGLHTEARTSFITFWLPSFHRYPYIALRFIPQSQYEAAAPMSITPPPDIVTRVFMVFRGMAEVRTEWAEALERGAQDPAFWAAVVGGQSEKQADATLFRVLEWGGMESHSA